MNGRSEIFKTNADSQPVHLFSDCEPTLCIAKVRNESPELLYLVDAQKQLKVYNTEYITEVKMSGCLKALKPDFEVTLQHYQLENILFKDGNCLHYLHLGDLWTVELGTNKTKCTHLGIKARELLAFAGNSIYFKDEQLNVYFLDIDWVQDVANLPELIQQPVFTT